MARAVNPKRTYDSSRRQDQARATRAAILDAARVRFVEEGYAATTVAAIAEDAGVSVETVYKAFRNKPGIVKAVFDVAVVGDDAPVPMMERDFIRRNMVEPDPRKRLTDYGAHYASTGARVTPILLVVRDAAASEPAAAELWAQLQAERLAGMTAFAANLHESGFLRPGLSKAEARDVLWTHNSAELWDLLVNQRGWTPKRFGAWMGQQLVAALL